ncbi:MAG: ABC transporter ATP-binding protein [Butyricicoccus sp.]|nr:ABC transporter ATP-binding protein [Butyricicoccus sp.]
MEHVLSASALCKRYRGFRALDDFSIHIPRGAIYGIVGKNGAGKTTLIRLICGLQEPSGGEYTLYGESNGSAQICRARRRVGAVVETPSIYMDMSARDNLYQQYRVLGMPSFEGVDDLLQLVGLSEAGKKKAKHFSLGMKQRLGIAIALAGDPDFLILDEPANGLDPQGIVEIRELILKLNRERQITVLISSHILDELSRLATHYGFIDRGHMVKEISAQELERSSRKCLRVAVTDPRSALPVLDGMGLEYSAVSDSELDIFSAVNISELVLALSGAGCQVQSMHEREASLESYFIDLIGGGAHE